MTDEESIYASLRSDLDLTSGLNLGREYKHAPIDEAILQLNVTPRSTLDLAELKRLPLSGYAEAEAMAHSNQSDDEPRAGFVYSTDSQSRAVHVAPDRFGFFWLSKPYAGWKSFVSEAEEAWTNFRQVAKPEHVNAISLRYINRIPIPQRAIEIKDYLRMSVDVPGYLPQRVSSLFMQVELPLPALDASALVTSGTVEATVEVPDARLLLDIDVVAPAHIVLSDERAGSEIAATFERLRLAKNYIFEACITDATRGLID